MKRLVASIALVVSLLLPSFTAFASDVSGALFSGVVVASNNSTAATDVSTNFTLSSAQMISNYGVLTDFTNTAMQNSSGADVAYMPSINATSPWWIFIPSIAANSYNNYILYAGGTSAMSGKLRYFPSTTGMTVNDHASLEPSANFSQTFTNVYLPSTGTTDLVKKDSAEWVQYNSSNQTLTGIIYSSSWTSNFTGAPSWGAWNSVNGTFAGAVRISCHTTGSGNDFYINELKVSADGVNWLLPTSASGTGWTDIANAYDNNTATYAYYVPAAGGWLDPLTFVVPNMISTNISAYVDRSAVSIDQIMIEVLPVTALSVTGVASGEKTVVVTENDTALSFGGAGYLTNATANFRSTDSAGAIECWFKADSASVNSYYLVSSGDEGTDTIYYIGLKIDANGKLCAQQKNNDVTDLVTGNTVVTNGLYHHAVMSSSGSAYSLFVDGVAQTLTVSSGSNSGHWFDVTPNRDNIALGAVKTAGIYSKMVGFIGTTRIYSRVMSQPEALANYQRGRYGSPSDATGLVFNLPMTEGTGNPVDTVGALTMTRSGTVPTWKSDLGIGIDGTYTTSNINTSFVPNTSANWTFVQSSAMPYIESIKEYVGGNYKGGWAWQYAETFTDLSGNGNTGYPSFRTTCSDADVSALLTTFGPVSTAVAPSYAVSAGSPFYSTNVTTSSNFTSGNITAGSFPGGALIGDVAVAGDVPSIWIWGLIAAFTIALGGLFLSWMERNSGGGTGTLIIRAGWAILVFGVLTALNVFDFWMVLFLVMLALAPLLASRHQEPGGAIPSELGWIGLLATIFVGFVTINNVLSSQILSSSLANQFNDIMFIQSFNLFGLFSVPIVNSSFFTVGIPMMLNFGQYSYFGGNAQVFVYLLYSLTAIGAFLIFTTTIGLLSSYFVRLR